MDMAISLYPHCDFLSKKGDGYQLAKGQIPKFKASDFTCPCSNFVCSIGACACHNIRSNKREDGEKAVALVYDERITPAYRPFFDEGHEININRPKSVPKPLNKLKLDFPPKFYERHGGDKVVNLDDDDPGEDLRRLWLKLKGKIK